MPNQYRPFPKLRTERIFPSEAFKRASRSLFAGTYMQVTSRLPNDPLSRKIVEFGLLAFAIDRTPLPIGEITLGACFLAAKVRHSFIKDRLDSEYQKEINDAVLETLRPK